MASSLLILLDDIAAVLDDVAVMTKLAAKKTAGVLGDDLALNAQQVTGIQAQRELPVVWAVAKGSLVNKLILVPMALLISALLPALITPLLMLGGLFLCYEGAEKVIHKFAPHLLPHDTDNVSSMSHSQANADDNIDLVAFEKEKIKGAIRTDFILSAEIVVISLGVMTASTLTTKAISLAMIALVMTAGVYGLVAMIVKMDDLGVYLLQSHQASKQVFGRFLLGLAPKLMKFLSVAGTLAMFLVGGGILVHGVAPLHHGIEHMATLMGVLSGVVSSVLSGLVGFVAGLVVLMLVVIILKLRHTQ